MTLIQHASEVWPAPPPRLLHCATSSAGGGTRQALIVAAAEQVLSTLPCFHVLLVIPSNPLSSRLILSSLLQVAPLVHAIRQSCKVNAARFTSMSSTLFLSCHFGLC